MSTHTSSSPKPQSFVACVIGLGVLVSVIFLPTMWHLAGEWASDASYSHGILILPLSLGAAIWIFRKRAGVPESGELALGGATILAGCLVHLFGLVVTWALVEYGAMVLVLRGVAVTLGGKKWANHFLFPTLFLFFMFPLPVVWTTNVALWLQDIVAAAAATILELFMVSYRQGSAIYVAGMDGPLYVAQQCSGLRQIIAFLAMGSYIAFIIRVRTQLPLLHCTLFILAAIPIAIAANIGRVLLMAFGIQWFGNSWLHGWMHDIPALITIPFGLLMFALAGWLLWQFRPLAINKIPPDNQEGKDNVADKALAGCD